MKIKIEMSYVQIQMQKYQQLFHSSYTLIVIQCTHGHFWCIEMFLCIRLLHSDNYLALKWLSHQSMRFFSLFLSCISNWKTTILKKVALNIDSIHYTIFVSRIETQYFIRNTSFIRHTEIQFVDVHRQTLAWFGVSCISYVIWLTKISIELYYRISPWKLTTVSLGSNLRKETQYIIRNTSTIHPSLCLVVLRKQLDFIHIPVGAFHGHSAAENPDRYG